MVSPSARLGVDWSPLPVCLVWIHRRGCSLSMWVGGRCSVSLGVDWPLWVSVRGWVVDVSGCGRCSLSDVRRWFVAVMWWPVWCHIGAAGCGLVAVAGVPGMDPPARLLSLDVGWWPLVGGDKRARLGCRGCHRRGSLPGVSVEISTVAAALTVCQRSPWVWLGCRCGLVAAGWSPW